MSKSTHSTKLSNSLAVQTLSLLALAVLVGLAVNYFSASRIQFGYNYYPAIPPSLSQPLELDEQSIGSAVDWKKREHISQAELQQFISHPGQALNWVIVDARKAELFDQGHIQGALKFDRYRFAQDLPNVLPKCMSADLIIVYCQGGKCEDSHIAKKILTQSGVSADLIVILQGGYLDWQGNGNEVEK